MEVLHKTSSLVPKIVIASRFNHSFISFPFHALIVSGSTAYVDLNMSRTHQSIHFLLERCSTMEEVKQIHVQILTHGLFCDTYIIGKLIAFCALSTRGNIRYAREVFDCFIHPNRFIWNSLIRGYSKSDYPRQAMFLLSRMLGVGCLPNEFTFPFVLKSCACRLMFIETLETHMLVLKLGFGSQGFVQNSLLHAYVACGRTPLAQQVFLEMPERNIVSWNSMIDGYCKLDNCHDAFRLFRAMRELNVEPDGFTLASLLSLCSQTRNLHLAKFIHHYMLIGGNFDLIAENALVHVYAKCGDLKSAQACFDRMAIKNVVSWTTIVGGYAKQGFHEVARGFFERMPERNLVSWNCMISCYVQLGLPYEAIDLYKKMETSNLKPDTTTLGSILSVCGQNGDLVTGIKIHELLLHSKVQPSTALLNSLVDMYAKCGKIEDAFRIFSEMSEKDLVSWNVMIGAFAMHGRALDGVKLFIDMVSKEIKPDSITFTTLLSACNHGGLVEDGLYFFEAMSRKYNVQPEIEHYACIVDLLGRIGDLEKAMSVISSMPIRPDIVIWGALLGACKIHRNVKIAKVIMKHVLALQPHDGGLYVLTSNLYCEANMWDDVNKVWNFMNTKKIRKVRAASLIETTSCSY